MKACGATDMEYNLDGAMPSDDPLGDTSCESTTNAVAKQISASGENTAMEARPKQPLEPGPDVGRPP